MELDEISSKIIRAAITVHKELGPGLLETVYQSCMVIELRNMGVGVESETRFAGILSWRKSKQRRLQDGSPGGR